MRELLSRIHAKLGDLWWYTILLFISQRIGDVINMFVGLWIVPKYVPMEELGAVLPMMNVVGFIGIPLSVVSIPFLKFVAVFAERGEMGKVKSLIRDAFVGTAILAVASCLLAWLILPFFFERLRIENGSLSLLLVVLTIANSSAGIFVNALDGLKKFRVTVWFQAIAAPVRLLFMLAFMPFRALSGYLVGQGAVPSVYIVGSFLSLRKFLKSAVRPVPYWKDHGREMMTYAWPLLVSAVVGAIGGNMDTLIIRHRLCDFESAGYYIVTRFSEMSFWIGSAFTVFLFPLLAGKNGSDSESRKLLLHSLAGTTIAGLGVSLALLLLGPFILSLRPEWSQYSSLAPHMALLALNCVLSTDVNCFVTAFTARGQFGFFWYYLPLGLGFSVVMYALTGYTFFEGMLPTSWLQAIAAFNPCRLIVLAWYMVLTHLIMVVILSVHAFGMRSYGRCE